MVTRIHRPLKVTAFNVNGTDRQCYELSKQLQDLHTDAAHFSETHLKPNERFSIPNYTFINLTTTWAEKAELQLEKTYPTTM
jgi:predicted secreted protein